MRRNRRMLLLASALLLGGAAPLHAQNYPTVPVQIVTGGAAGGSLDVLIRLLGVRMSEALGQSVVVVNRPGAGGLLAVQSAAASKPDGYTLLFTQMGALCISPAFQGQDMKSLIDKFEPVTQVSTLGVVMTVHAGVPARNLQEFVAYAKAQSAPVPYATPSNQNSLTYLYSVLLTQQADFRMSFVPYKLGPQALLDLSSGRLGAMFDAVTSQMSEIRNGRVRPIAMFSNVRSPLLPDVPTAAEQGFGQVTQGEGWYGLFAPAGTPRAVVERVNAVLQAVLREPEVRQRIGQLGMDVSGMSGEKFKAVVYSDAARWSKLIKDNKIASE